MKRTRWIAMALVVVFVLSAVGVVYGIGSTAVNWHVFGGGGAQSSSGNVNVNATIGQTAIGASSSSGGVGLNAGYWAQNGFLTKIYLPLVIR